MRTGVWPPAIARNGREEGHATERWRRLEHLYHAAMEQEEDQKRRSRELMRGDRAFGGS